ncbi:MAG: type II toxin-antitoxin system HicB family antitoxin [Lachnospiraceae bacterium]|nr:type II toxin-antitoxin system HicB family antitoxin [Lachnospiraceae bacterium]MBQ8633824.1 type II toxin-antitoxin system HicB family antitoxin [Lachnospiraceae bacterium]
MLTIYPACFYKEEQGYSVIFPDLNWLSTCGNTLEQAMEMAIDCLAGYIYSGEKCGDTIPAPSAHNAIDPVAVAKELDPDSPVGECFVNMVSVDVAAYAKMHFDKPVKKTLTIPMWLNNAALAQNINFSQVLQEALLLKLQTR